MEQIKERITNYWTQRAESFADLRIREFHSEKRSRWLQEINKYLPQNRKLRILDIGTGTGFFAFLLTAEGHEAVGVDLTEDMIHGAEETAAVLGLTADFRVMDAEELDFEPESFDALVTRNLTWTLPNLRKAYSSWYKLLKPGGVAINFDADYCRAFAEAEETELPEDHAHKFVKPELMRENNSITMEISAYQETRPQWDVQLLTEAGFERIVIDTGVYKRIYAEKDEFYNPTPIFTIAAYK